MSLNKFYWFYLLLFYSFVAEAGGGGAGASGSGATVPFLHPLLNVLLVLVISFFCRQSKK